MNPLLRSPTAMHRARKSARMPMSEIQQIYCTHCTHGNSALQRQEGELRTACWATAPGRARWKRRSFDATIGKSSGTFTTICPAIPRPRPSDRSPPPPLPAGCCISLRPAACSWPDKSATAPSTPKGGPARTSPTLCSPIAARGHARLVAARLPAAVARPGLGGGRFARNRFRAPCSPRSTSCSRTPGGHRRRRAAQLLTRRGELRSTIRPG